ncbi:hypothetical protein [Vibrio mexicanus]|uniref:hypothetical protein n=1 Tax=Vibrio mexicanus TaxID=1004326 RepID=UPI000AF2E797
MLVANKTYTDQANQLAEKISRMTEERHAKWLVSLKYLLDQSEVDSVFSRQSEFCDTVITKEEERITNNQRLLLECEAARVKEKRKQLLDRQALHQKVVLDVSKHTENVMVNS